MRARAVLLSSALAVALLVLPAAAQAGSSYKTPQRPADAVVVDGAELRNLQGLDPDRVVGFRHRMVGGKHRWKQIPVQIDERADVDLGDVYDGTRPGIVINAYTDAGTFTGPDPDPGLDADDELAFMARGAGGDRAGKRVRSKRAPRGVAGFSAVQLRVADPLAQGRYGFVYLYRSRSGSGLQPAAGKDLVDYRFRLRSGDYKGTYDLRDGPNPEATTINTRAYTLRFTDRWITNALRIRAGGADARDILDRRKAQFAPGFCGRSTDTFTDAEGAYIASKDGPVRAIRSYVGANSGPLTQREHVFYDRHEQVRTFLRVHRIPGIIDFFDYSPQARGMRRRVPGEPGALVDGRPENRDGPAPEWEQLSGAQGTLTHVNRLLTTARGLDTRAYYLDDSTPNQKEETQCTGDAAAFGASGTWLDSEIPNTDPMRGPAEHLTALRDIFYDRPGLKRLDAARRADWVNAPLRIRAR